MNLLLNVALALALILGGISKPWAAETNVVASIFPLHSLAAGVMKGVGEPALLLQSGLSPHEFSLKPSQAELLQSADLLFWVGKNLEYPLARYTRNLPPGHSLALGGGGEGKQNPHIWLAPQQAKKIVSMRWNWNWRRSSTHCAAFPTWFSTTPTHRSRAVSS